VFQGIITKEAVRKLKVRKKFPFTVKAIEIDGGSDFKAQFEEACLMKQILLFELLPSFSELSGRVRRAKRRHGEEFCEIYEVDLDLEEHNRQVK